MTMRIASERGRKEMDSYHDNTPPSTRRHHSLVKCKCVREKCTTKRCQCRKAGLTCTDLCSCSDTGEGCKNMPEDDRGDNDEEVSDDEDDDEADNEYMSDTDDDEDC